jgi:hypothetical protein
VLGQRFSFRNFFVKYVCPDPVVKWLRERLGHQIFQEASSLCRPAATGVQRLNSENKGGFSYIPFRAGYRNGRYSLSYT